MKPSDCNNVRTIRTVLGETTANEGVKGEN
jgi:hypothetical protein